jgi:phosphoribosylformylglycinamidine synthase
MSGPSALGAEIAIPGDARPEVLLFNESQSRIVLSAAADQAAAVLSKLSEHGVPATKLGTVGGESLRIAVAGTSLTWPVETLRTAWSASIPAAMGAHA